MTEQVPSKDLITHLRTAAALHSLNANRTNADDDLMILAADELERLQRENDTCGLQCSATMKSLMAEVEQLKQDLTRSESARVAILAENTHYKQEAARSSLDAKIGGALMGRGFYDRMQDQTDEDTAARIVHEFLEVAKPIVSAHYRRALPPGDVQ